MFFQEGIDAGALLYPLLFIVGLFLLGLVIWLVFLLTRTKKDQDVPPVKQQLSDKQGRISPYILAIGRTGTQWEIYVKGKRATADTNFDSTTRKEALEALRVLAQYARGQLRVDAQPMRGMPETVLQTTQTQSGQSSQVTPPSVEIDQSRASTGQPRVIEPAEHPTPPPGTLGLNLVQEIGEIVDEMLSNTPSLQEHAVNLIGGKAEGINFVVDGTVYDEVEEIPHQEIRDLIRKATEEWGRR